MWQLYQFPLCPFSRKVRLLMSEKGVGYELQRESPWDGRGEFFRLNPAGRTPVLVDPGKGTVLVDSRAICEYFEETVDKNPMINGSATGFSRHPVAMRALWRAAPCPSDPAHTRVA